MALPMPCCDPAKAPLLETDRHSFADLVDRTLASVKQVLVSEHIRLVYLNGSAQSNAARPAAVDKITSCSWATCLASEPTVLGCKRMSLRNLADEISEEVRDDFPSLGIDSGTQTKVDWSFPLVASAWGQPSGQCAWLEDNFQDEVKSQHTELQQSKTGISNNCASIALNHGLDTLNRGKSRLKGQQVTKIPSASSTFKRLLYRRHKNPLDLLDLVMGFVIIANALAIGASCDMKIWQTGWIVVDSIFAVIFLFEILVRFRLLGILGFLCKGNFIWAWCEVVLVVSAILEVTLQILAMGTAFEGTALFRVVRLLRLVKIIRLCRVPMVADLVMMLAGLIGGARTLFWANLLVLFPIYLVALVLRETLGAESARGAGTSQIFDTLPKAIFHTFRCLVVEDCTDEAGRPIFVLVADSYGWAYSFIYCFSTVFLKFGLYNVIIAIFVEQTVQAAKHDAIYQKRLRLNDQMMFEEKSIELVDLAYELKNRIPRGQRHSLTQEEIENFELNRDEFNELCINVDFKELLTSLDVAEEDHLDLFDTLDVDGGGTLDLGEIVEGIGKLRGDAKKSDIVSVILLTKHINRVVSDFKDETHEALKEQQRQVACLRQNVQLMLDVNARSMG